MGGRVGGGGRAETTLQNILQGKVCVYVSVGGGEGTLASPDPLDTLNSGKVVEHTLAI